MTHDAHDSGGAHPPVGRMRGDDAGRPFGREEARDRLPDWVAGRLPPDEAAHLDALVRRDASLRREAEILRRVAAGRPNTPVGLHTRIAEAVREDRAEKGHSPSVVRAIGTRGRGRWLLAAAAVAVIAVGLSRIVTQPVGRTSLDQIVFEETTDPWLGEEVFVAGGTVLDALTQEDLTSLLEELGG